MKYALRWLLLVDCFVSAGIASGADDEALLARLDQALTAVPSFEHGQNSAPLNEIEQFVFGLAPDSPLRGPVEERLLADLASATTRDAGHSCASNCTWSAPRRASRPGRAADRPRRCSCGADRRWEDWSFRRRSRPCTAHCKKTSGKLQAGIVHTLADRRIGRLVRTVPACWLRPIPTWRWPQLGRLGFFGDDQAVRALREARTTATGPLAAEIDNGLLNSAAQLAAAGKAAEAAAIYESFYQADQPRQLRSAGLRGLVPRSPTRPQACWSMPSARRTRSWPGTPFRWSNTPRDLRRPRPWSASWSPCRRAPGPDASRAGSPRGCDSGPGGRQGRRQRGPGRADRCLGSAGQRWRCSQPGGLDPAAAATGGREQEVARRSLLLLPGRETDNPQLDASDVRRHGRRARRSDSRLGRPRGLRKRSAACSRQPRIRTPRLPRRRSPRSASLAGPDDTARLVQLAASVRGPAETAP
jgi:hypothetical protein